MAEKNCRSEKWLTYIVPTENKSHSRSRSLHEEKSHPFGRRNERNGVYNRGSYVTFKMVES